METWKIFEMNQIIVALMIKLLWLFLSSKKLGIDGENIIRCGVYLKCLTGNNLQ